MNPPPGDVDQSQLQVQRVRVYYDAATGDILHVHQLASSPGDDLGDARIDEEMEAFAEALRRRDARVGAYLEVDGEAIREAIGPDVNLRVDLETESLVRDV